MKRKNAVSFLEVTLKTLPFKLHTVLTERAIGFARKIGTERYYAHPFDAISHQHSIEHRLTKPFHASINGQVKRMNRTIKQATTKAFYYALLKQLQDHLKDYLWAFKSARPVRALKAPNIDWFYPQAMAQTATALFNPPKRFFPGPNA